jgi:hypothetical protein
MKLKFENTQYASHFRVMASFKIIESIDSMDEISTLFEEEQVYYM